MPALRLPSPFALPRVLAQLTLAASLLALSCGEEDAPAENSGGASGQAGAPGGAGGNGGNGGSAGAAGSQAGSGGSGGAGAGAAGAGGAGVAGASGEGGTAGNGGTAGAAGSAGQGGAGPGGAGNGGAGQGGAGNSGAGAGGAGNGGAGPGGAGNGGAGSGGAAAICPEGPYAGAPFSGEPKAQLIQGGFSFLEGPVWFADEGALYFSNMKFSQPNPAPLNGPAAELVRFTPPSSFEVILENSATNGLAIDLDGGLIACTHDTRSVSRIDLLTGARTIVADKHDGKRFNSPNDLVLRPDGHLYFSDPDWQLSQTSEQPMAVYWRAPSGEVTLVDLLDKPTGVALSPGGQWLYVGAIDGKIRRYPLASSGAPGPAQPFASVSGPDGMTTDCAGNVYISGSNGVAVFDPEGAPLGKISGTGSATNVAFGGPDRRTLYITAGKALHAITLDIPGYPY